MDSNNQILKNKKNNPSSIEYPRIAMLWKSLRKDKSVESIAKHDLIVIAPSDLGFKYNGKPIGISSGFTNESIKKAKYKISAIKKINPNAIILVELYFYEYNNKWLPKDHEWWLKVNGERQQFWPGTHRMDWNNKDYQRHIVQQTLSLEKSGVDGVFYDNVRGEPKAWKSFLQQLRKEIEDNFMVLVNAGGAVGKYDFAAPYVNGIMYESGWGHNKIRWRDCITKMQKTQTLLRNPKISIIERFEEVRHNAGWPEDPKLGKKPPADVKARRWSLCYSLIVDNFYYLFADNTSHEHDWHLEYDVKIGLPKKKGVRISAQVWKREYEKAIVIVNLPGAKSPHVINLDYVAKDTLSGRTGKKFIVKSGDGCILIQKEI